VKRLLLDTNVVIWLLTGEREAISDGALEHLTDESNALSVSAVSPWEIATKRSLGRLELGSNWFRSLLQLDFEHMPITAEHAARCEALPWHHRDPFDRMLVAQAISERHTIVSADRRLGAYEVEVLW
jgi:PIN domain nuclease of toxin-antitoxin system